MPKLLLLRHAKAERARAGESDHERALAKRGRDDSATMGRVMAERGETPDLVLCSTSLRTRQTWELLAPALKGAPEPRFLREIFEAGDYLPILRREGGDAGSILLVGHNPTIMAAALQLAASLGGADGGTLTAQFPTAALAILQFAKGWSKLKPGTGKLLAFIRPREADTD